ncbi:MAG: FAD-dependent thymidylate synthase [bacterium]|nr:FAD-dependent thymidylate synthase [bacterium]
MKVSLLRHTPDPELLVASAAKLCYSKAGIEGITKDLSKKKQSDFIKKLLKMGHLSPFEHISFTFGIEGISRACTHQLVRHRIASFSQQSQRYVSFEEREYIVPRTIKKGLKTKFDRLTEDNLKFYQELIEKGVPKEDARYILPQAFCTKIVVTMNARELFHFFNLRCCNRAQWEIREMAEAMLSEAKKIAPNIFMKAGAPCVQGTCPEGELSCGRPKKRQML